MKLNIGVLFGGNSVEHEVSVISANQAMAALNAEQYEVIPLYLTKDQELYSGEALRNIENYKNISQLLTQVKAVGLVRDKQDVYVKPVKGLFAKPIRLDVLIPVVHGTNAEDGSVQGFAEVLGLPYAGSDIYGAAVGQDKAFMKMILEYHNVPMVPWMLLTHKEYESDKAKALERVKLFGMPAVVKPSRLGSSVGITVVRSEADLTEALEEAFNYDLKLVIEKAVTELREINCAVLGHLEDNIASVCEEVMKKDEILSYHDKYQSQAKSKGMASTARICPAELDEETTKTIQELSQKTFAVLGCSGVSRIDFLLDKSTNSIYVNEINTIPGSLAFYLWEKSGISFQQLMDRLVKQAIDRHRQRQRMTFSFDTNLLSTYSNKGAKGGSKA